MRILRKIFTILSVLLVIVGMFGGIGYGVYYYYFKRNPDQEKVRYTISQKGDLKVILKETATLKPKRIVPIKSKVSGRIVSLSYEKAGADVQAGSKIAELDRDQYERALQQAKRNFDLAEAKMKGLKPFGKVVDDPSGIDPTRMDILVDKTLIQYAADKMDYENKKEMFSRNLISIKMIDDARKLFERSFVAYHDAVREASLTLQTSREKYAQAIEDLAETTIVSPVRGVLTKLPVNVGELVQGTGGMTQGTTLAEVADLSEMLAVVNLNEVDVTKIKVGDPVTLTLDSEKDKKFNGLVESIAPSGEAKNNIVSFEVKITLLDQSPLFKPEMTANADILVGQATDVVRIPIEAISEKESRKKITLLTLKPDAKLEPTPTPAGDRISSSTFESGDFYKTEFGIKKNYDEKEVEIVTGLTNELWAEVISGITSGVTIKLPDVKIPEKPSGLF